MTAPAARSATEQSWNWGRFPELSFAVALGVALVAAANIGATDSAWWAEPAFYGGLLLLVLPVALRLIGPDADGTERVSLVALLAFGLFMCKVVHDPVTFGAFDEFLHWRTAQDLVAQGNLFTPNSLLAVSPYYPGLEFVSTAISQLAGIPIFEAGIITLVAARLVFIVSMFFFFAMVSGSTRVAGIACFVYMTNPKFLYFDAQFSYESLALPLAALVLYLLVRRGHSGAARWLGLTVIAVVTVLAVVLTHHVTSAMLAGFLLLWAIVGIVLRRRDRAKPGRFALLTTFAISAWIILVASATIGYLGPALTSTLTELLRLIAGNVDPRELFTSPTGVIPPLWERVVGSGSALLVIALLPLGLFVVWRRYRTSPAVVALAVAACAYPLTLVARYTQVGAEVAGRTPEFLFIAIGLVVALALARLGFRGRRGIAQMAGVATMAAVLFVGGVIVGVPGWARLPGPYLVSADGRSIETEGVSAARMGAHPPWPGQRDGRRPRQPNPDGDVRRAGADHDLRDTPAGAAALSRDGHRADAAPDRARRQHPLSAHRPPAVQRSARSGPLLRPRRGPHHGRARPDLDPAILAKFDRQPDASRVFDSGNIQLYDVTGLGQPT